MSRIKKEDIDIHTSLLITDETPNEQSQWGGTWLQNKLWQAGLFNWLAFVWAAAFFVKVSWRGSFKDSQTHSLWLLRPADQKGFPEPLENSEFILFWWEGKDLARNKQNRLQSLPLSCLPLKFSLSIKSLATSFLPVTCCGWCQKWIERGLEMRGAWQQLDWKHGVGELIKGMSTSGHTCPLPIKQLFGSPRKQILVNYCWTLTFLSFSIFSLFIAKALGATGRGEQAGCNILTINPWLAKVMGKWNLS